MKPLSGYIEVADDLLTERTSQIHRGVVGLGPPDLVQVDKVQPKYSPIAFYHHLCGYKLDSEESVQEYFALLVKLRSKTALKKRRYSVPTCQICCWNSFRSLDVRMTVSDVKIVETKFVGDEDTISEVDGEIWKELGICSVLRFWTAPTPLFRSLYNVPPLCYPALRMVRPPRLTEEEIVYFVEHHEKSETAELALAGYLVSLGDWNEVRDLLKNVILRKMPRVVCWLFHLLPRNSEVAKRFMKQAKFAYTLYPDDCLLGLTLVQFCADIESVADCEIALPLLKGSMWSSPVACCAMAKVMLMLRRQEDCLYCLNAAFYAKMLHKAPHVCVNTVIPQVESRKAPRGRPNPVEREVFESQKYEIEFFLYETLHEAINVMTLAKVRGVLKNKFRTSKDHSVTLGNESMCAEFPPQSPMDDSDLDFLYDPGVESDNEIPDVIRRLPLCQQLSRLLSEITEDFATRDATMNGKRWDMSSEIRKALLTALKLQDWQMLHTLAPLVKSTKKLKAIRQLIMFRLASAPRWNSVSRKIAKHDVAPHDTSMNEHNALTVVYSLAEGIDKLLK